MTYTNGGYINGLPFNWHTSGTEDLLDSCRDLRTDSVTRDQSDLLWSRRESPGIDGGLGHLKKVSLVITI